MKYRILMIAVIWVVLLSSCNRPIIVEDNQSNTESLPESSSIAASLAAEIVPQTDTDTWTPMLEGYKIIQQDGGREHVLMEITPDAYRPIEDYPDLLPYCEADIKESREMGAAYSVEVATADVNNDGFVDYFLKIDRFLFGQSGPLHKLLLGTGERGLIEIEIDSMFGNIAIMDTETNGLPDIAFSSYRYRPLYHYYPDFYQDGRNVYLQQVPAPLYISKALTSYDSSYIKDGKLYWKAFKLEISGSIREEPFYVGATFDLFDGLLREPILWAHDEAGNILEFEHGISGLTCWFVGEVLDEDRADEILRNQTISTPIFPDDYVFANVESLYYPEYGLAIKPHLRPDNKHEKSLLMRLGEEVQKYQAEALQELSLTNPKQYESLKGHQPEFITCLYGDFDGDGACEMLAEIAAVGSFHIWFVDDVTVARVESCFSSYSMDKPFVVEVQGQSFAIFKGYGAVSFTKDCMIGFREGTPYTTNISGMMIDGTNEYGEVLVVQTTYDSSVDGAGRTWKPYWYYLDEDGNFKEYGGAAITVAEVYAIPGAKDLLDEHLPADAEITGIYYRANGLININYIDNPDAKKKGQSNFTLSIRHDGTQSVLEDMGLGVYLDALHPDLAVYPS